MEKERLELELAPNEGYMLKKRNRARDKKDAFCKRAITVSTAKKHIKNFLRRNNTTNFDKAILSQIDEGRFPVWTKALIEWDANPCNTMTMKEFCKFNSCHNEQISRIRRKYPGYWTAVKYKQREFLNELGVLAMKALARRVIVSDRAVELALIITGNYVPTLKHQIEPLSPEEKKVRIEQMLSELKKVQEIESKIVETSVVVNGSEQLGHKSE